MGRAGYILWMVRSSCLSTVLPWKVLPIANRLGRRWGIETFVYGRRRDSIFMNMPCGMLAWHSIDVGTAVTTMRSGLVKFKPVAAVQGDSDGRPAVKSCAPGRGGI